VLAVKEGGVLLLLLLVLEIGASVAEGALESFEAHALKQGVVGLVGEFRFAGAAGFVAHGVWLNSVTGGGLV
jgi:hypothetical protein